MNEDQQKIFTEMYADIKVIKEKVLSINDHEKRIRVLEKSQNMAKGIVALISSIFGGLIMYLIKGN